MKIKMRELRKIIKDAILNEIKYNNTSKVDYSIFKKYFNIFEGIEISYSKRALNKIIKVNRKYEITSIVVFTDDITNESHIKFMLINSDNTPNNRINVSFAYNSPQAVDINITSNDILISNKIDASCIDDVIKRFTLFYNSAKKEQINYEILQQIKVFCNKEAYSLNA